jgi:hypothetical protein
MAEVEVVLKGSGTSPREVDPDEKEVLSKVIDAVRQAGAEKRCRIEIQLAKESGDDGPPTILTLIPSNPQAAVLGIQLDHEAQITFYVGRHQSVAEDYNRDRAKLLGTVRSFVMLALSGSYREYVKLTDGPGHKAISKFQWPDDGKPGGFTYNVWLPHRWSSLGRKGWQEEAYEAY